MWYSNTPSKLPEQPDLELQRPPRLVAASAAQASLYSCTQCQQQIDLMCMTVCGVDSSEKDRELLP
jgi:hypothetical protein